MDEGYFDWDYLESCVASDNAFMTNWQTAQTRCLLKTRPVSIRDQPVHPPTNTTHDPPS